MPIRPEWETVIRPVVDFALPLPNVDPGRIALSGWSLGGYLALRGLAEKAIVTKLDSNPRMRWRLLQRLWVHRVANLHDYAEASLAMILEGRVGMIACLTLLTTSEDDILSKGAPALLDELTCPKAFLPFFAAEGAGDHREMGNRSLATLRMLDWLADTLRLDS